MVLAKRHFDSRGDHATGTAEVSTVHSQLPQEEWRADRGRFAPRQIGSLAGLVSMDRAPRAYSRLAFGGNRVAKARASSSEMCSVGARSRTCAIATRRQDLLFDRKLIFVREGKGKRDRYVPVGQRATEWLARYIREARPAPAEAAFTETVFLSRHGRPLNRDHLTWIARQHVAKAKLGRTGACHLFRHTMATLMHQNGADIRFVQEILGHADIRTTQIYTQVSLRMLQRVYNRTHPAA